MRKLLITIMCFLALLTGCSNKGSKNIGTYWQNVGTANVTLEIKKSNDSNGYLVIRKKVYIDNSLENLQMQVNLQHQRKK